MGPEVYFSAAYLAHMQGRRLSYPLVHYHNHAIHAARPLFSQCHSPKMEGFLCSAGEINFI